MIASDDGKFAVVEFVARNRAAFLPILSANNPAVKCFEKGRTSKEDIEREIKKTRADFALEKFLGGRP